ncbi:lipopolysaccharide/colanic/teichoic acid biosynthesis glycosyltransferase [Comamonas sp. BIGb0124]|uniref:sugar transferase n=1 Tax=Comamonas sp. BIGb0124 TaxID=2485130 RepID=UPI000F9D54F2|nr:sugar transferase [Comamonas sp. BIGb0124]ROR18610.1 lipopolysaccharide/colanic/teichoic acid biosynthesis glycosyltransferase [Comamonas sp. BIGb0124]
MYASRTTDSALMPHTDAVESVSSPKSTMNKTSPVTHIDPGPVMALRATDTPMTQSLARQRGAESMPGDEVNTPIVLRDTDVDENINHSIVVKFLKRGVDVLGSLLFFAFFGWLYFALAVGVWISSGRPILFSQKRYGYKGETFEFYKFRSMVPDAEAVLIKYLEANPAAAEEWNKYQKLDNDPRITRFGHFIRKTSLDELPQFWNVLKGDMSLVGPRPCLLSQKTLYGKYWSSYIAVRPGITGLWQVSGRNTVSYRRRVLLDVRYVQQLSIVNDISIFLRTVWVVCTGHGSK